YLGCYTSPSSNHRSIIFYKAITITQCKETCKAMGKPFMGVRGSSACYCVDETDLKDPVSESLCTKTCATGQICGATDFSTIYKLDYNETAASCVDLFDQGVLLSGLYLLSSGLTWCGMKDSNYLKSQAELCAIGNTACDLDMTDNSWEKVGTGNLDLAVDTKYWTYASALTTRCDGVYSPATIVSPAKSQDAINLISEILQWSLDYPLSKGAFIGLVDEFTMGIFSYSDGSIFRINDVAPNASDNGLLATFLTSPTSYAHAQVLENGSIQLVPTDSSPHHIVCQRDTAFQGCFTVEDAMTLSPIISSYQSMTLTLCRQACQGQSETTILISSTECACSNLTHLMTQVANISECNQPCLGSSLQQCGEANNFRMYTFDPDIVTTCQELIDNFVLLPLSYNIDGNMESCGLDDKSIFCPTGFIAASGQCYRPNPRQDYTDATNMASSCASQKGYLASPTSTNDLTALTSILNAFTAFKGLELWMLGYSDLFSMSSYVTAVGQMIDRNSNLTSHLIPDEAKKCVALNTTSGKTQIVSCSTALPFVCQANSYDYEANTIQYSCDDLLTYGIVQPGTYLTEKNEYYSCFKYSDKSNFILTQQSTTQPQPLAQILFKQLILNSWALGGIDGSEVTFVLDTLYVIEGLVSTGNYSSISLSTSLDGMTYEILPGNQNISLLRSSGLASWAALPHPAVAKCIKIELNPWSSKSESGSFEFVGYDFKLHNFTDHFLGCFDSQVEEQGLSPLINPDLEMKECLDYCDNREYRYVTLTSTGSSVECQCVRILEPRDPYSSAISDQRCNATCFRDLRCSTSNEAEKTVYTKLDFFCSVETWPHLNMDTIIPDGVYISATGTFPIGTTLTLTCDLGYEFNHTNTGWITSICSNLDEWGLTDDDFKCSAVDCGPFPEISGAIIVATDNCSTLYNSTVQYKCESIEEAFDGITSLWTMSCEHTKQWLPQSPPCERKLCQDAPPTVAMATSNATLGMLYTLGTIITFTCNDGMHFPLKNDTQTSTECIFPGLWLSVEDDCENYRCPGLPPAMTNTTRVQSAEEHKAFYRCDPGLAFPDRHTMKAVWCNESTLQWDMPSDQCTKLKKFQGHVCLARASQLSSDTPIGRWSARGLLDCAQLCLLDPDCVAYNFNKITPFGEINCFAYGISVANLTLSGVSDWNVYSVNGEC
ncbi:macrophage mannose receptor 1-like, partial [Plakobranchus ocellatus]